MDLLHVQKFWTLSLLFIFSFFCENTYSVTLDQLNTTCVFHFPKVVNNGVVTIPPDITKVCTAVATYSDKGKHPPKKKFGSKVYEDIPFVHIFDDADFNDLKSRIKRGKIQAFIGGMINQIKHRKIDVLIFDVDCSTLFNIKPKLDIEFNNNLKVCLDAIKKSKTGLLVGLMVDKDVDLFARVYDTKILGKSVDLYVARTYNYKKCTYEKLQSDMVQTNIFSMMRTISGLKNHGISSKKLFITIRVHVPFLKNIYGLRGMKLYSGEWTYSETCLSNDDRFKRFCRETLKNFYEQGKIANDKLLGGVFIEAVDYDDYIDNCSCGCFAATYTIADVVQNRRENTTYTSCLSFGKTPLERAMEYGESMEPQE